uniref:Uncharacterized protein n=1 Tax=Schistosoma haematobium TaxID=6185 RepID=A0A095AFE9_SCHHA
MNVCHDRIWMICDEGTVEATDEYCYIAQTREVYGLMKLYNDLIKNVTIKYLDLSGCDLGDSSCIILQIFGLWCTIHLLLFATLRRVSIVRFSVTSDLRKICRNICFPYQYELNVQ